MEIETTEDNTVKVYVYGTLMPPLSDDTVIYNIPGQIYDLGWFPGAKLSIGDHNSGPYFKAQALEVTPGRLRELDQYEGYDEKNPRGSLYLREKYLDGYIYVYNSSMDDRDLVPDGDWRSYINAKTAARDQEPVWRKAG